MPLSIELAIISGFASAFFSVVFDLILKQPINALGRFLMKVLRKRFISKHLSHLTDAVK